MFAYVSAYYYFKIYDRNNKEFYQSNAIYFNGGATVIETEYCKLYNTGVSHQFALQAYNDCIPVIYLNSGGRILYGNINEIIYTGDLQGNMFATYIIKV